MNENMCKSDYIMVRDAMNIITELNIVNFVKDFDNEKGFMFSDDRRIVIIGHALDHQCHSGASFAYTLRQCQYYFKHPGEWKQIQKIHEPELHVEEELALDNTENDMFFEQCG
jgi:hypothetical protein